MSVANSASSAFERPDNSVIKADTKQKEACDGFMKIFKSVLPEIFGFQIRSIRPPDVVLVTNTGEFTIDAASGGLTTIIELAPSQKALAKAGVEFLAADQKGEGVRLKSPKA